MMCRPIGPYWTLLDPRDCWSAIVFARLLAEDCNIACVSRVSCAKTKLSYESSLCGNFCFATKHMLGQQGRLLGQGAMPGYGGCSHGGPMGLDAPLFGSIPPAHDMVRPATTSLPKLTPKPPELVGMYSYG